MKASLIRSAVVGLLLFSPSLIEAAQSRIQTVLEKVLVDCRCVLPGMGSQLLSTIVVDSGVFSDDEEFVVAYWTTSPDEQWSSSVPLHVIHGNRRTGEWRESEVPFKGSEDDTGPIESIQRTNGFFVLKRRVATDGGSAIILSSSLKKLGNVYYELGSEPAVLPNGVVIYRRGQPHFAPTHYVELAAFDMESKSDRDVYPTKPFDRVRALFIAGVRERWARRGEEWFNTHNHHADPELFDNSMSDIVIDWKAKALAFVVRYEDEFYEEYREGVRPRPVYSFVQRVVVTCDGLVAGSTVTCHETSLEDWKSVYPNSAQDEILKHAAAEPTKISWQ